MNIHRRPGRPRVGEDTAVHRVTLRVPLKLWLEIKHLADLAGVTPHAWMRQAIHDQASGQGEPKP